MTAPIKYTKGMYVVYQDGTDRIFKITPKLGNVTRLMCRQIAHIKRIEPNYVDLPRTELKPLFIQKSDAVIVDGDLYYVENVYEQMVTRGNHHAYEMFVHLVGVDSEKKMPLKELFDGFCSFQLLDREAKADPNYYVMPTLRI